MRKAIAISFLILCFLLIAIVSAQVVEQPQISNVKIDAYWKDNGAKTIDIQTQAVLAVHLIQTSTVRSYTSIHLQGQGVIIHQLDETLEVLDPQESKTIFYTIENPGGINRVDGVTITVVARETYMYTETSQSTVYANLLPTQTPEPTPTPTPTPQPIQSSFDWTVIVIALIMSGTIIAAAVILSIRLRK